MDDLFSLAPIEKVKEQSVLEILNSNSITSKYGLSLSKNQIERLINKRLNSLRETGRIEFGQGVLKELIYEFCDSPYIMQENYEETLEELLDIFYYYKSEALEQISDEELITLMKKYFDGECQGSLDYLRDTTLEDICRDTRFDRKWKDNK